MLPQSPQNFLSLRFSAPQFGHLIVTSLQTGSCALTFLSIAISPFPHHGMELKGFCGRFLSMAVSRMCDSEMISHCGGGRVEAFEKNVFGSALRHLVALFQSAVLFPLTDGLLLLNGEASPA